MKSVFLSLAIHCSYFYITNVWDVVALLLRNTWGVLSYMLVVDNGRATRL